MGFLTIRDRRRNGRRNWWRYRVVKSGSRNGSPGDRERRWLGTARA